MKKIYLIIIGFALVIGICIITSMLSNNKEESNSNSVSFIYDGEERIENNNITEMNGNYPSSVKESGIIKNDTMAYNLSSLIISSIYGEECFKSESPAHIRLINDSLWSVSGSLPKGCDVGGTYSILIDKYSGRILRVWHEK